MEWILFWIIGWFAAYALIMKVAAIMDKDAGGEPEVIDREYRWFALRCSIILSWAGVIVCLIVLLIYKIKEIFEEIDLKKKIKSFFISIFDKKIVPFLKKLEPKE
jgi:hypothetical protein